MTWASVLESALDEAAALALPSLYLCDLMMKSMIGFSSSSGP
eukprot:CAMPEP_0183364776 /NCGR_PEP_ID=MMETSP0164_2-20130417/81891_1 /TAXON_ID=221442 /ORGANISM="Coccolithus pelagicus ssp braarudi, Strain PLY182g" /LENGTH=41 /DNA_ID= /DNA_START= /DNA_END= /DNA_ORIENTATION=